MRSSEADRTDAAIAAELVADRFPNAIDGINARTYGPPGLEEDIAFCAQVSVLDVVPRLSRMVGPCGGSHALTRARTRRLYAPGRLRGASAFVPPWQT